MNVEIKVPDDYVSKDMEDETYTEWVDTIFNVRKIWLVVTLDNGLLTEILGFCSKGLAAHYVATHDGTFIIVELIVQC